MSRIMARIGSVPYLNARPLLEGLNKTDCSITEFVPAKLYNGFENRVFDVALLSSIDVLSLSDSSVVDGVAIASRGAVHSVILAYMGELKSVTKIQLDPASHTSNALLQIVLGEFYGFKPEYVQITDLVDSSYGRLLIGDPAIAFRKMNTAPEIKFCDLGEEWYRYTGLPFVYALWIFKEEFTKKKLIADTLRSAKSLGLSRLHEIAARTSDPDFALRYFTSWIGYDLGDEEKRGLGLFQELLMKHQMILPAKNALIFV